MAAPKLPASIRVGHLDFAIVLVPGADIDAYGDCNIDEQRIRIAKDLKPQIMADTVWHEVTHACFPSHLKNTGGTEENVITYLSPNHCNLMRDNPGLMAWMQHALS